MIQFIILNALRRTPFYVTDNYLGNDIDWWVAYGMHRTIDYNFVPGKMIWFMGQAAKRNVIPTESYMREPIYPKKRLYKKKNLRYSQALQLYLDETMRSLQRS